MRKPTTLEIILTFIILALSLMVIYYQRGYKEANIKAMEWEVEALKLKTTTAQIQKDWVYLKIVSYNVAENERFLTCADPYEILARYSANRESFGGEK